METHKCRYCGKEIKIRKKKFAKQTIAGHELNCNQNPESRWYKGKKEEEKVKAPTEQFTDSTPDKSEGTTQKLPTDKIEGDGSSPAIDQNALLGLLSGNNGQSTNTPGEGQPEQPMIVQDELSGDHIPSAVVAEWVLIITSVNMDLAIAYCKKKSLKSPSKLEMSSATSRWLGKMISQELGPQKSSYGLIVAALAPYLLTPWMSIMMQSESNPLAGILARFKGQSDYEDVEEDES
jgi:hypothetical protein